MVVSIGAGKKKKLTDEEARQRAESRKQTFQIGNTMVSREEFKAAGFGRDLPTMKGEPEVTPERKEELKRIIIEESKTPEQRIQEQQAEQPIETAREIPQLETGKETPTLGLATREQTNVLRKIKSGKANAEEIRQATENLQLNELDLTIIQSGEADVNKIGQFIEDIPVIPRELKKFVPAFSSPSKKVEETKDIILKTKDNILLWSDLAKSNPATASRYVSLIQNSEQEVLKLESKIKLITIQSPDLQANPEQVDLIQSDITNTKTIIQNKREELELLGIR